MFVKLARILAHLDQHLDRGSNLCLLDDFPFTLSPDLAHKQRYKALLDSTILDHMVLELTILHILNQGQVELGHVVLVHVQEDVSDHDDALLNLLPDPVELAQELLIVIHFDVLGDRFEKVDRGVFDAVVKHLSMLVEHEGVGGAVQFLVAETARLLVVDLVDGVLDGLPVLLGLRALHVGVAHLVPINQEFVRW